jgi:hypothetical protein
VLCNQLGIGSLGDLVKTLQSVGKELLGSKVFLLEVYTRARSVRYEGETKGRRGEKERG